MPLYLPSLSLSTDNAAMIAAAGLRRYRSGVVGGFELNAEASLVLDDHRRSMNNDWQSM